MIVCDNRILVFLKSSFSEGEIYERYAFRIGLFLHPGLFKQREIMHHSTFHKEHSLPVTLTLFDHSLPVTLTLFDHSLPVTLTLFDHSLPVTLTLFDHSLPVAPAVITCHGSIYPPYPTSYNLFYFFFYFDIKVFSN